MLLQRRRGEQGGSNETHVKRRLRHHAPLDETDCDEEHVHSTRWMIKGNSTEKLAITARPRWVAPLCVAQRAPIPSRPARCRLNCAVSKHQMQTGALTQCAPRPMQGVLEPGRSGFGDLAIPASESGSGLHFTTHHTRAQAGMRST